MENVENKENVQVEKNLQDVAGDQGKNGTLKKTYGDNEAPIWRWIVAFIFGGVLGLILGSILYAISRFIPVFAEGGWLYCEQALIQTITSFGGLFVGFMLGIKIFCNTSLKTFLFGKDRKPEIKTALIAGAFYLLGCAVVDLITFKQTSLTTQPVSILLINFVLVLLFLGIQTTAEEIIFRGFFLRPLCGDKMPKLVKGLLLAFLSSFIFMVGHLANPEVSDISGLEFAAGAASYFFSGFFFYVSNLLLGGMEGGVVLHYLNNFYCLVIIGEINSAVPAPTIFVKNPESHSGYMSLLCEFVAFGFAFAYIFVHNKRKKAAAGTAE